MPTPLELILDPVSITVFAIYAGLVLWERVAPARSLPPVQGWWLRGLSAFAVFFFLSSYLPLLWSDFLGAYQVVDLSGLGKWGGAAAGLLVYEAAVYVWHRTMHASNRLWLGMHQMHHSAERLDSFSAYWFSPMDMVGWTALGSLSLTLLVGISAEAATLVLYMTTFMGIFQHSNVHTPRWLGYIIQRPESHSFHHERGVHARNYSDLPLYDLIFGTFYNPPGFATATGFYDGASSRVTDMILFKDISSEKVPETRQISL